MDARESAEDAYRRRTTRTTLADMDTTAQMLIAVALAALLGLSAYATVRIWRDRLLERGQRIGQTVIVWLVPVLGPLLVLWLLRDQTLTLQRHEEPGRENGTLL